MGPLKAFYFNQVSSLSLNLVVEHRNIISAPSPILEQYQIPGRDETLYRFTGFENALVEYETFLKVASPNMVEAYMTSIKNWLLQSPGEYFRLEDDYDLDHYRMAAYVTGLEPERNWKLFTRQTIQFSCKPYRYLREGDNQIDGQIGTSLTIYNPTQFTALPEIVVNLAASVPSSITIEIEYEDGEDYSQQLSPIVSSLVYLPLYIDSESQTIYTRQQGLTNSILNEFPVLKPGNNTITISAGVGSVFFITPRWREL